MERKEKDTSNIMFILDLIKENYNKNIILLERVEMEEVIMDL